MQALFQNKMLKKTNIETIYTSFSGEMYKGYIFFTDEILTFNNSKRIIARIHKDEITSFKIKSFIFKKNISIRINGKNHIFSVKNKSLEPIINFIKK